MIKNEEEKWKAEVLTLLAEELVVSKTSYECCDPRNTGDRLGHISSPL